MHTRGGSTKRPQEMIEFDVKLKIVLQQFLLKLKDVKVTKSDMSSFRRLENYLGEF